MMIRRIPILTIALLGQFVPGPCAVPSKEGDPLLTGLALQSTTVDSVLEPGAIVGRVLGETDGGRERPLEGARVVLRRGDRVLREVHTNADGFYAMREVPPGEYGMVARAEGFLPEDAHVVVRDGHETEQNFLLPLRPGPGAVVGRVLGVVGGGEVPLAGALLTLNRGDRTIREARTNDEGFYAMPEVPPGEYGMVARAEGFLPEDAHVVVESEQETHQDFRLQPRSHEFGAVVGRVLGAVEGREVPLAGALVVLRRGDRVIRETHTNDAGNYAMPEVPVGEYGIIARAEGFMPEDARIEVVAGHETQQDFLLHPARRNGVVFGRVLGAVEGREVPLRGALVVLLSEGRPIREARTGDEGWYEMPDVEPGEYGMIARAEGFLPEDAHVVVESGQETRQDFLLRQGDRQPGAIAGRVMEPFEGGLHPLPGALVTLHAGIHVIAAARTNEEGFFEMPQVPPGVFALMAQAEGHHPAAQRIVVPSGDVVRARFVLQPVREP